MNIMIANKLIKLRKEYGYSQEELAFIIGTSRQAISKWERAEASPEIDNIVALAKLYNVSIDYLLNFESTTISLENYIEKLNKGYNNKDDSINLDEIIFLVSKHKNNFKLLFAAGNYLYFIGYEKKDKDITKLSLEYLLKSVELFYQNDNDELQIEEIYSNIANLYVILGRYDEAITFIKKNRVSYTSVLLAKCYIKLSDYDSAINLLSRNYLTSVFDIINGSIEIIKILKKEKRNDEALKYNEWILEFIKSISIGDNSYMNHIYALFLFMKAMLELSLKKDYEQSLKELAEIIKKKLNYIDETTDSLKFYYGKKESIFSDAAYVKKEIDNYIESLYKDEDFDHKEIVEFENYYRRLLNE